MNSSADADDDDHIDTAEQREHVDDLAEGGAPIADPMSIMGDTKTTNFGGQSTTMPPVDNRQYFST